MINNFDRGNASALLQTGYLRLCARRLVSRLALGAGLLLSVASILAAAQSDSDNLRFDVVSLKAIALDSDRIRKTQIDPALVTLPYISLSGILVMAYGAHGQQFVKPDWFDEQIYEIVAKPPAGSGREQLPIMFQNLLVDRFHLKMHWETRELNGYTMVVSKTGLKLTPVGDEEKPMVSFSTAGHLEVRATPLATFADRLTGCCFRQNPVVDWTGVGGKFDFVLDFAKEDLADLRQDMGLHTNPNAAPDGKPSIFGALRSLGLELKAAKVNIRYLVVESCLRVPISN